MKHNKDKKRSSAILLLMMTMLINSCSGSGNKPPVVINNYCNLALDLPKSDATAKEMKHIRANAIELFKFVEVSSATKKCECKPTDQERQDCWKEFENLRSK